MGDIGKTLTLRTSVVTRTKRPFPWRPVALFLFPLTLLLLSCLGFLANELLLRGKVCLSSACVRTASSLLGAMDLGADPCEDFFQFACGNWNREHVIPEDRASISTFEVLSEHIQVILKGLLEEPLGPLDSDATKKAKDFYASCLNITGIRAIGDEPLWTLLKDLGGWPVTAGPNWTADTSTEALLGKVRSKLNIGVILELWIGPDDKNSSNNIIQIDQMQLGLPSRDYFLNASKELLAYEKYIHDLAVLLGASPAFALKDLAHVLRLETLLANASLLERQETSAIYQKHTLASLQSEVPAFNWRAYLEILLQRDLSPSQPIVTYALPYLKTTAAILTHTPKRTIQNYVIWRILMEITSHLVDKFQEKKMEFRRVLMGVSVERSRWNQCVDLTNKKLGMALGALFIRNSFDNLAKETAEEMIGSIREAFVELLEENPWMDIRTKMVAKEKATRMRERIGYPEYLTQTNELNNEHVDLTISRAHFLENILRMAQWRALQNLGKLGKPVDKEKWNADPAVVNAFYDPNKNDIVFPAGILQPLFYSKDFPKSLNYGGIGVVIGHEITHGFDDRGRQFDADGNLDEWWNNETIAAFRSHAKCIIEQYNDYEVSGLRLNGQMTQGENIADNGGLKQAFRAFKKWEGKNAKELLLPGLEWLSHDQLFFLNYAQIWCGSMRPEDVQVKIRSAVHSPGPIRVLGPLSNSREFSSAFSCPVTSRMNPPKKCVVW